MKKWGNLKTVRLDEPEFKTDLGDSNFIFVGSSCDMWADNIPDEWIIRTLKYCYSFDNQYFFQTKNPGRILSFIDSGLISKDTVICTTLESNKYYKEHMQKSPHILKRIYSMKQISEKGFKTYVTVEPVMDFDLKDFLQYIKVCNPAQVNIGADSKRSGLPEPDREKLLKLISELRKFTSVHEKSTLKRLSA